MKKNMIVILVGVTALHVVIFSGLFASGGCKNVVMDERRYVPAEGSDAPMTVDPMENVPPTTSFRPAEPQTRPVAAPSTRKSEAPTYQPMASVASNPISTSSTTASSAAGGTYEVKAGDTVGKIAHQYGVSVSAMLKANNLDLQSARRLRIGQKLVIPGKSGSAAPQKGASASSVKTSTAAASAALAADGTYVIKAGDTLGKIARRLGVKTADLQKANNLTDAQTRRLQIGQKLVVPGKSARTASTAVAAAGTAAVSSTATATSPVVATTTTTTTTTAPAAGAATTATTDDVALDLSAALNEAANAATAAPAAGSAAVGDAATAVSEAEIVIGSSTPVEVTEEVDLETFATNNKTTVEALKKLNSDLPVDGKLKPGLILFVPAAE